MNKIFGYFVSFVIMLFLLTFLVSTIDSSPTKSSVELIRQAVTTFSDEVRQKGYLDPRDYDRVLNVVTNSGLDVSVTLEHHKKRFLPLYDDANNYATFNDEFEILYESYYDPDILKVLYPTQNWPDNDPRRRYKMNIGDLFQVYVEIQPTLGETLRAFQFGSTAVPTIRTFGGAVLDES